MEFRERTTSSHMKHSLRDAGKKHIAVGLHPFSVVHPQSSVKEQHLLKNDHFRHI